MRWPKKKLSRHFRKNMSLPEVLLWKQIKGDQLGFRIRRQASIGDYVIDFYCAHPKVAIEVDGSTHQCRAESDKARDAWLNSQGILVYRISASWILKNPFAAALRVKEFLEEVQGGASGSPTTNDIQDEIPILPKGSVRNEPGE